MKKKKIIVSSIILLIFLALAGGIIYYYMNVQDKNALTNIDKQWIESNKNEVTDLSIVNNIPIFNYDGSGVLFDYVNALEKVTGLEFNKLSYNIGEEVNSSYGLIFTNDVKENDTIIYNDNYVILTNKNNVYNNLEDIPNMVVAVLKSDKELAEYYLKANTELSIKEFANYTSMFTALTNTGSDIDAILVPKTVYLKEIISNKNVFISYNVSDMKQSLVLRLGDNGSLNSIMTKYLKKWLKENYNESFSTNFTKDYFAFSSLSEQEKINFSTSKTYKYGFVEYAPYDKIVNNKLVGLDNEIIKSFANTSSAEITWEKYKNYEDLLKAFKAGKIDFYLDRFKTTEIGIENYKTSLVVNDDIVIISTPNNDIIVDSLASLKNENVLTIKNSKIEESLNEYGVKTTSYDSLTKLLKKKNSKSVIAIDKLTYQIYASSTLKNYSIDYEYKLYNDYTFLCNNSKNNQTFNEYLNFYLSFVDRDLYTNLLNSKDFKENNVIKFGPYVAILCIILLVVGLVLNIIKKIKDSGDKNKISKEDKLRYIDSLTSLKNRNYLNDSIEKWDNSEIYPQSIIIVDLNNVAYINDNYGHEEGDDVIRQAAGILITNQIENSEIIRTNGNEFLIYLVGYDEKQVVTFTRKLNKDFKDLNHGFGAAIGYSMIIDAIKTIDDAINEATLDMRNNKEETQN